MPHRVFNVGDRVRVRSWDDMAAEFGVNDYGEIACVGNFVEEMEPLCGRVFTITAIDGDEYFTYKSDDPDISEWDITGDMLVPASEGGESMPEIRHRFNVGDRCRIRQWDDMEAEFGLTGEDINCAAVFVRSMRGFCGREFTIAKEEILPYLASPKYIPEEKGDFDYYTFTGDMLELIEDESAEEISGFDPEDFLDALTDCVI